MALTSPGLEVTVTDDSQYLPTAVGTVPLILFASAENKVANGVVASGTLKEMAGKLQAVTSQRELISAFGSPTFYQTSAGTPIHGHELNEYGLMAAYSALGITSRAFLIRADIDTNQLVGSEVRPRKNAVDGTFWFDYTDSSFGVYKWTKSAAGKYSFQPVEVTPITDPAKLDNSDVPLASFGQKNTYAIVLTTNDNRLYYKDWDNTWVKVGGQEWQASIPTIKGTVISPTITAAQTIVINGTTVTASSTTLNDLVTDINTAAIDGVEARNVGNTLVLTATSAAESNGTDADGKIAISDGTGTILTAVGITAGTYSRPLTVINKSTENPSWLPTGSDPRPVGSLWIKASLAGAGADLRFRKYNAEVNEWPAKTVSLAKSDLDAIKIMDPSGAGGGAGIPADSVAVICKIEDGGVVYHPLVRTATGKVSATGDAIQVGGALTSFQIKLRYSTFDSVTFTEETIPVINAPTPDFFATAISAADIPEVEASWDSVTRKITITHLLGGVIQLEDINAGSLAQIGFVSTNPDFSYDVDTSSLVVSNFDDFVYTYTDEDPFLPPDDGTLWYYNSPADVDIMINTTTGWKGYKNEANDARGHDLSLTDPDGVIVSASKPTTQSDGTALVSGDLWLDSGELENFPKLYRYAAGKWEAIDTTDQVSQDGIIFADARWSSDGTADPIGDVYPTIESLLESDYLDLDAPDYRLYPRGMLLFNTRRSGFNVKRFVANYFNDTRFPDDVLPGVKDSWISASGLKNDGSMFAGAGAQRAMVLKALKGAIDGSETVRESSFAFNLMACPGYPELIPNLVALNNDRKNTAFVIGDTPMTLKPNIIDITNWSTNALGDGLATADPYFGVYYPSALSNDLSGNTIVVPASHIMLRTMIRNDNVAFPWLAPAGTRRGLVDNATDVGFIDITTGEFTRNGLNNGMRDALYSLNINPITVLPGIGLVVFGQKTRNPVASALDRVNVARLVNYIRTVLARAGDGFLFEPNDAQTRREFKALIESVFVDLVAKRGIYDYLVVCDESNNTPDRIARNELYCDVACEPAKAVEFIYIPVRLKNPGAIKAGN